MIIMTVKCYDLRKAPPREGEFDRAWYRIVNEETNQTIDYQKIKEIEKPDGVDEDAPFDEENDDPSSKQTITYVAGRLFYNENCKWIYESYNNCFAST